MDQCHELIREYCDLLHREQRLNERKETLRQAILAQLCSRSLDAIRTEVGSAKRTVQYRLTPRTDAVLALLTCEDVLPFARFTPPKVRDALVPKYGRERLIPLFEIQKTESLTIHRVGRSSNLPRDLGDEAP